MDREREMAAVIDRLEANEEEQLAYYRVNPPREASQVYSIRVPVERLEELRSIAADRGLRPSSLMRDWIIERLKSESRDARVVVTMTSRHTNIGEVKDELSAKNGFDRKTG
jgi:hypothetical protein